MATLRKSFATMFLAVSMLAGLLHAGGAFDPAFQQRAMVHVRELAALGGRVAGSEGESKAAAYVKGQMEKAGLRVTVEPFEFDSFVLESAVLTAGENRADIQRLGFDPYAGGGTRTGQLAFLESTDNMRAVAGMDLDGKIVVATERANLFALGAMKKPLAVAILSAADFQRLQTAAPAAGGIAVRGNVTRLHSANLVATLPLGPAAGQEIILSAHYDSWHGPGANDNASGVATLLELARYYASLKPAPTVPMRFVVFGGEELGMAGSRAYLDRHRADLENCRLLFNMDTVGGAHDIYVESRGGIRGVPQKVTNQIPKELMDKATNDIDARWILLNPALIPLFDSANVPDWLNTAISETGKELGLEIKPSRGMGSDHRVFVQAGVVATNIAISGEGLHTPLDAVDRITPASLEKAAQVVESVVRKAIGATK